MNGPYTEEEKAWLRENAPRRSYGELARMLTDFSGRVVRAETLCEYCRTKLGIDKAEDFGFKRGGTPHNVASLGTEVVQKGRTVLVKVGNSGDRKRDWIAKTKLVFGDVPNGHIIIFLDGNPLNVVPENMVCVPQKVHARLAKNRWFFREPELTRAAIKWCEHLVAIKDFEKEGKHERQSHQKPENL